MQIDGQVKFSLLLENKMKIVERIWRKRTRKEFSKETQDQTIVKWRRGQRNLEITEKEYEILFVY